MTHSPRLKVMTVVGTRPEIIRLAPTLKLLDAHTEHVLVHTGQNYDYELNEVFFQDLGLRRPDHFLEAVTSSLGAVLGTILMRVEAVIEQVKPDALLVLGDTNSAIALVMARRMKIPTYHMEAGNRCFDANVPEETNRRMIDHVADYNLVYTEHARRNLLREGIHPSRILLTGSPMREVLDANQEAIAASNALQVFDLAEGGYFLASVHREENVDNQERLTAILSSLNALSGEYGLPVLISTHPRTRRRLEDQPDSLKKGLIFHRPFGFHDYVRLQQAARLVLSDSGTVSEESTLLGFPAVTLRDAIERPESIDTGGMITAGVDSLSVVECVRFVLSQHPAREADALVPDEYSVRNTSHRVVSFILGTARTHMTRAGIR